MPHWESRRLERWGRCRTICRWDRLPRSGRAQELSRPARGGNQAEIYRVYLKGLNRADIRLGAVEINYVEKLAAAFRGEKHRAVCGRGGKGRFGNFLKCTTIRSKVNMEILLGL